MTETNHFMKGVRSIANEGANTVDAATEGRALDAVQNAWNGATETIQEFGNSVMDATRQIVNGQEDKQGKN